MANTTEYSEIAVTRLDQPEEVILVLQLAATQVPFETSVPANNLKSHSGGSSPFSEDEE